MTVMDRFELLTQTAKLSETKVHDVEIVLGMMPRVTIDISCQTDGEEGVQEGDIVTMCAWVTLKRRNDSKGILPHTPYFPFHKEECFWLLLADEVSNEVWISRKVSFMDEYSAVRSASREVRQREEGLGAGVEEVDAAVRSAAEKVRGGSRLVVARFIAPREGTYNLTAHCLCDAWVGCDAKVKLAIEVSRRCSGGTSCHAVHDVHDATTEAEIVEEEEEEECDVDYDSEYSEDDEDDRKKTKAR